MVDFDKQQNNDETEVQAAAPAPDANEPDASAADAGEPAGDAADVSQQQDAASEDAEQVDAVTAPEREAAESSEENAPADAAPAPDLQAGATADEADSEREQPETAEGEAEPAQEAQEGPVAEAETGQDEPAAPAPVDTGEPEAGEPFVPQPIEHVEQGDILRGVISKVDEDVLVVNVGYKAEGVVPKSEMTLGPGQSPKDAFEVGEPVDVTVLSIDPQGGNLLLSERRARSERVWDNLQQALEKGTIIKAPVVEAVKGGLVIDVGVRAFMPASHVARGFVSDLNAYVGKNVRARVIELDQPKQRVILSQKVVLEEEHEKLRQRTWAALREGIEWEGVVKGLTDFGAFVDLGGVDGLLHVSEMAWNRVDHPSDVVQEGQTIKVKILKVDHEQGRISLSLKQTLPDPWLSVAEKYPVASVVRGTVKRLVPFGAFVELEPGVEGLIHISELAHHHVKTADEVVQEGQTIDVKVLRVQPDDRRISLSLKATQPKPERERPAERASADAGGDVPAEATTPSSDAARGDQGGSGAPAAGVASTVPKPTPARRKSQKKKRPPAKRQDEGLRRVSSSRVVATSSNGSGGEGGITLGEMFGDLFAETKERLQRAQEANNKNEDEDESDSSSE